MPRKSVPSYRLHKPSGQARTIIHGRHIYLGKFNSPESREKYARLLAELSQPNSTATSHSILEFCARVPARRPELGPGSPSSSGARISNR